jgi:uncharacterized tellurite resistance protein B-like protein
MRTYPRNGPRAAARIVALALLADGNLSRAEIGELDLHDATTRLGLKPAELNDVVNTLCDDLLTFERLNWADSHLLDPHALATLIAEVDDPELRLEVLRLCVAVVEADGEVGDGEALVLNALVEQWGLECAMLERANVRAFAHS